MSIDQLKARRRELLARKKYELDLQAKGEGDPLDLFVVEEELLSVNAQLRMLNPQVRVGTYRSSKDFVFDKQQFKEWVLQDQDQDEETQHEFAVQHKAAITEILRSNEVFLTDRQREIISLWEDGESITQIAERLRVNSSTVSRTVSRAVQTLRWISDRKLALQKRGVGTQVDMSDPEISKTILSALTEKQAVDLYLYYAEWLSLREIGDLTGVSHSTICRTIHRGLDRIAGLLHCDYAVLENMDFWDELVFDLYKGVQDLGDDAPENVRPYIRRGPSAGYRKPNWESARAPKKSELPVFVFRSAVSKGYRRGSVPYSKHGKLLQELIDQRWKLAAEGKQVGEFPIFRWLVELFGKLTSKKGWVLRRDRKK